jgi:4-amino-4-deoxy-L-arabinose transferase-like glycosyltransferase
MVDEINQVMTETLTITLINLTLALSVILFISENKLSLRYLAISLGLITGLLMIIKLSTILTPLIILIFISILKFPIKEKLVTSALFLIIAISPSVTSSVIGANSETSQTWYGLVAYAIEFQSEKPLDLKISPDAEELLESALRKRAETWKKYPEIVREYDFTYQKTPISLFYGALPAAQELGFDRVSHSYTSELFKEISISSFYAHKDLVFRALAENLKVPSGLFKLDGQYISMSKILKNPMVYAMFFAIFIIYFSRRAHSDFLLILLIFFFGMINYLVVSIFNGPIPRYFYLYDPLLLYSIIIMWSKCLSQKEGSKK